MPNRSLARAKLRFRTPNVIRHSQTKANKNLGAAQGLSNKAISKLLNLPEDTVGIWHHFNQWLH